MRLQPPRPRCRGACPSRCASSPVLVLEAPEFLELPPSSLPQPLLLLLLVRAWVPPSPKAWGGAVTAVQQASPWEWGAAFMLDSLVHSLWIHELEAVQPAATPAWRLSGKCRTAASVPQARNGKASSLEAVTATATSALTQLRGEGDWRGVQGEEPLMSAQAPAGGWGFGAAGSAGASDWLLAACRGAGVLLSTVHWQRL